MSGPSIWINTGEVSGDLHGAHLLEAFKKLVPDVRAMGMGGRFLREAGQEALLRVEDLSVMGFTEVLGHLPKSLRMWRRIRADLTARRPDAVILIDAPAFNFRVASIARDLGIPVYYYISPKVWAWREGRVAFLKSHVKRLFCIFPFEKSFYAKHGMDVDYVGNPLLDMLDFAALDAIAPEPNRIALMPGSRKKEVRALMAEFGGAARLLLAKRPDLEFECMAAPSMNEDFLRSFWPTDIPLTIRPPEVRYQALRRCAAVLAASGTATLETALLGVPTAATYKGSALSAWIVRRVIRVRYVSLANLIFDAPVIPELLQEEAVASVMAKTIGQWLDFPEQRAIMLARFTELRELLGPSGAASRVARRILEDIHFR